MSNKVDRIFESVQSRLPLPEMDETPDWDEDCKVDDRNRGFQITLEGLDESTVFTLDDYKLADQFADRISSIDGPAQLNNQDQELIAGGLRHHGMEALAFYKSKRFEDCSPFKGKWGIFYLKQGIQYVAGEIQQYYPGYGSSTTLAIEFLRRHEFFHFQADLQTLYIENLIGKRRYHPLRKALRGRESYFVEEALANRNAYLWSKSPRVSINDFAEDFFDLQPGAYARYKDSARSLTAEWLSNTVTLAPIGTSTHPLEEWEITVPSQLTRGSLCPQWVVLPKKLSSILLPAWQLPPVSTITDDKAVMKVLGSKYRDMQEKWEDTKRKLISNRLLPGLGFKPWPKGGDDYYSVKVDRSFRAHLRHHGKGVWIACEFGSHKHLGHG